MNNKPGTTGDTGVLIATLTAIGVGVCLCLSLFLAGLITGEAVPFNPLVLVIYLATGKLHVSSMTWVVAALFAGIVLTIAGLVSWRVFKARGRRVRGDNKARLTGGRSARQALQRNVVAEKAQRLGITGDNPVGYRLGRAVDTGEILYGDFESVSLMLSGPRGGKTAGYAIPLLLEAPGCVLATSNKRDLVDATRYAREQLGEKVWVFDPCNILGRPGTMWWNPLTYLTSPAYGGSLFSRATHLAKVLGDAARAGTSTKAYDSFWDGGGEQIRACLLAAAALEHRSMADVYTWVQSTLDETPIDILRNHGMGELAALLRAQMDLPAVTKGGMWAHARSGLEWVGDPETRAWWDGGGAEFNPAVFVQTRQALYSMSVDGAAISPLVAALTAVTCLAAENYAQAQHGGRLSTPMMVVLDEAANVCPWRELPRLYSHMGSKGICLHTILQSWSQGVSVWGEAGMNMLWSAANNVLYAGGVKETEILAKISKLIGTYRTSQRSTSLSKGVRSTSISQNSLEVPIASEAELAALPAWRAWLFASKSRPTLIKLLPWFEGENQELVEESIARYGSNATPSSSAALGGVRDAWTN